MANKFLLLGKDGQVGWELQRALAPLGEVCALGRADLDVADGDALAARVRALAPTVVVNAAAYTAVDRAEQEADEAWRINADAPGILAREAKALGAWLVHYSTDYVFDGRAPHPYREDDAPAPLGAYGRCKWAGEQAVAAAGGRHLIFRSSWVYAARGRNFPGTILRLAREQAHLRVVADQVGAPTSAELIADITAHVLRQALGGGADGALTGTYHLAAAGETSWHGYACHLLARARALGMPLRCDPGRVEAVPAAQYLLPALRPANSRLDTGKLRRVFGLHLPAWEAGVDRLTQTLCALHDTDPSRNLP